MDSMSGFDIRLVFTLPPRDSTLQDKRCVHLWNNFPCIKSLKELKITNSDLCSRDMLKLDDSSDLRMGRGSKICKPSLSSYSSYIIPSSKQFYSLERPEPNQMLQKEGFKGLKIKFDYFEWKWKYCGRQCLATLNKFHKIQQNEIERIRGIVLKNIYMYDLDINIYSEPSSNKL